MSAQESSESPPDAPEHDQDQDQEQEQEQDHDHEDGEEAPAKRQKRSRACQACRSMKIRCLPVEGQEACKACAKVNRACIMPGPARKRQKTVHKVAELEKKIDALTASLIAKNAPVTTAPTPPTDSPATTTSSNKYPLPQARTDKEYSLDQVIEAHYPPLDTEPRARLPEFETGSIDDDYEDVIVRGIIDETTALRMYEHWKVHMCPFSPIVAFPDGIGLDWLRKKRPMTLLSIFVAVGGIIAPDLQPDLAVEVARQLADRVMFYNEKSLDLIQAMLIYTAWYGKHKFAKDLGFNNYIHVAVSMCLDMGLGKRTRHQKNIDPEDAEIRRTWMGCYFMAGSVATVLRLPPIVKFSPYLEECLESFANHPAALPTDGFLCCLVKLTHLTQDVNASFHMDDPGSSISLNDSRTQYQLKLFERQLDEYITEARAYIPDAIINQYEAILALYIHEIALHSEHNVDDFRPMYRTSGLPVSNETKDFLTNSHFESLTICVDSMQKAMQAFLDMNEDQLFGIPVVHIVWTAYVAVAMIRLHGILAMPGSKYGSIFLDKLDVIRYLDRVINKLSLVADRGAANVPAESFVVAFKKLKAWHIHRTVQQQQQAHQQLTAAAKAAKAAGNSSIYQSADGCIGTDTPSAAQALRRTSTNSNQMSPTLPQQQFQPQFLRQYAQMGQPFGAMPQPQQFPIPNTSSALLDPNATIDASTFDVQNWDFSVGELDSFETYLNDSGWMGYLM